MGVYDVVGNDLLNKR